jgi:hypothetical protein
MIFLEACHSSNPCHLSRNEVKTRVLGKELWPWATKSSILLKRLLRHGFGKPRILVEASPHAGFSRFLTDAEQAIEAIWQFSGDGSSAATSKTCSRDTGADRGSAHDTSEGHVDVTTAPDHDAAHGPSSQHIDGAAPAHRIGRHCAAQQSLVRRIRMKSGDGLTSEPSRLGALHVTAAAP